MNYHIMKTLYFVLALYSFNNVIAQFTFTTPIIDEAYITTSSERYTNITEFFPEDVIGSPYVEDVFQLGAIYEDNKLISKKLYLRYNAAEDDFEIKKTIGDDDSKIMILMKTPSIYVKIANNLIIYDESANGYFQILFLGNTFNLYKKLNKKLRPARRARNSFEKNVLAKYMDETMYFLVTKKGDFHKIPDKRKKRLQFFGNKKSDIEKYVTKYDLDINDEDILIKLIRYFDSFEDASL